MSRRTKDREATLHQIRGQWAHPLLARCRGQEKRKRPSLLIGPAVGPDRLTESEARASGAEMNPKSWESTRPSTSTGSPARSKPSAKRPNGYKRMTAAFSEGRPSPVKDEWKAHSGNTSCRRSEIFPLDMVDERRGCRNSSPGEDHGLRTPGERRPPDQAL